MTSQIAEVFTNAVPKPATIQEAKDMVIGLTAGWDVNTPVFITRQNAADMIASLAQQLEDAQSTMRLCKRLFDEALPKFNWGASCLDANAITLLNEAPIAVRRAIG